MASGGSRELQALLDTLVAGDEPSVSALVSFSAMDREEAEAVRQAWPGIVPASRRRVIAETTTLAEDNVDLEFTALARIALADADPEVRALAVAALWESEDRVVAEDLTRLLRDDPAGEVRAAAASGLRGFVLAREFGQFDRRQGDDIVNALRSVAVDEVQPPGVRAMAIEALGPCSLPWVRGLIEDAYYSDDRGVHLSAIHAMGASASEEWAEVVIEQLASDDPEIRFAAASASSGIASEEMVEPLAQLLGDEDREVAFAAVRALGEIGGEEALERLKDFRRRAPAEMEEALDEAIESARSLASLIASGPPGE